MGGRRSRRLAIRDLQQKLIEAEERAYYAARGLRDGWPDPLELRLLNYHAVAIRAALAAMEEFGLCE
jgi:hypothetical protein